MNVLITLVYVAFYATADAALAPFITPCRASDSACLKSSAQMAVPILAAGVPSLGIQTLDPMTVDRVRASQAGLDMDFRGNIIKGLRNCVIVELKRQDRNTSMDLKCSVTMVGEYTLGGKLLNLPIEGNGKYIMEISDILVKILFEGGDRMVNGEKHWVVNSWKHSAEVLTNVEFHFLNLFNGNEQLSHTMHEFANSNWRDIFREVAPPIVKAIVSKIVGETTKLFERVPERELTLP